MGPVDPSLANFYWANVEFKETFNLEQRRNCKWINLRYQCSSFFFNDFKLRQNSNEINCLHLYSGEWACDQEAIRENLLWQYILFEIATKLISRKMRILCYLTNPLSERRWKLLTFIKEHAYLGPRGVRAKFFSIILEMCYLITEEVTYAVLDSLNCGHILKYFNMSYIKFVPKKSHPEWVKDCRPISLCNIYRLLSKCLVNRLRVIFGKLLDLSRCICGSESYHR